MGFPCVIRFLMFSVVMFPSVVRVSFYAIRFPSVIMFSEVFSFSFCGDTQGITFGVLEMASAVKKDNGRA